MCCCSFSHESSVCILNDVFFVILSCIDQVVGIIDYMRQYDIIKRMERMGKSVSMIAGQAQPTIVEPSLYKARFKQVTKTKKKKRIKLEQCTWHS